MRTRATRVCDTAPKTNAGVSANSISSNVARIFKILSSKFAIRFANHTHSSLPALATKWSIDPADNKKWTFELRKGVKFHDGCDWNADSAVWNYERLTLENEGWERDTDVPEPMEPHR